MSPTLRVSRGDEDDDDTAIDTAVGSSNDGDADGDNEVADNRGKGYYDGDDAPVRSFGREATPREAKEFAQIADRFTVAGRARDGRGACALMKASIANALVEEYGSNIGPRYLRGARTCPQVMSRFFEHERRHLSAAHTVIDVRVGSNRVLVLFGSRVVAASYLALEQEKQGWRVAGLHAEGSP
jgi:hypothetical protein